MRINSTVRLGLIVLILGVVLLFSVLSTHVGYSYKATIGRVEPGDTFAYGLFLAPVGVGNISLDGETVVMGPEMDGPEDATFVTFVRLVVVSPSGETLVDMEGIVPFSVSVDFTERGEYVVYVTNLGDETVPIPVAAEFPRDNGVVNREADKFLVSIILTVSGTAILCIGLSATLLIKPKKAVGRPVADAV
ncbi:MAG: hypothetical protein LBE76_01145 [Nitrososphaerota archaeon]|jgi:hypothetical protein|nr:hypothetical protein [Nitrososphaerota archaeon]